jgi:hypothetical protein
MTRNAAAWMLAIVGVPRAIVERDGKTDRFVQIVGLPRAVQHGFLSWVAKHHPGATEKMKDHDGMLRTAPEMLYHDWIMNLFVPEETPDIEDSPDKRWWNDDPITIDDENISLDCYPWLATLAEWRYPPEVRSLRTAQVQRLYATACLLDPKTLSNAERKLMNMLGVDHVRR